MIFYTLDIASWQGDLRISDVARAGFDGINLKTSHGVGQTHVHPKVASYAAEAKTLGLGISTFHWLTADTPGAAQASYAYGRLQSLGLTAFGRVVDVEAPGLTWPVIRDYVRTMAELPGGSIFVYSADWRWEAAWAGSALSPYLWAAPNDPKVADPSSSASWQAGYGGWPELSVLQYGVAPLSFPDGTIGTIKVSKSAVRDPQVWTALTGGGNMTFAPAKILEARAVVHETLPEIPLDALGVVGDDNHAKTGTSYHLGKSALRDDSYSIIESSRDRKGLSEAASAFDFGWWQRTVNGKVHNLRTYSVWAVKQCVANTPDTRDIREIIYSPDGKVVKRWDRLGIRTTGDSGHLVHTHHSWFRDSENRDKTALFKRYFNEIGLMDDMSVDDVRDGIYQMTEETALRSTAPGRQTSNNMSKIIQDAMKPLLAPVTAALTAALNDNDKAEILAAVEAARAELETAVSHVDEEVWAKVPDSAVSPAEKAALLRAVLGDDAAAVGALLAQPA